jgi:hypothetical protein
MGTWTIEQWVAVAIVWLWGTWLSGKLSGRLQGGFDYKILAIYPYYQLPAPFRGIPAWLVGTSCAWLVTRSDRIFLNFLHFSDLWTTELMTSCELSLFVILPLTYFGWLLPNQFRIAGTVADATAMRWKSMKPYDHD